MLSLILIHFLYAGEYKLSIEKSKLVETKVYLNQYEVISDQFINFVKTGNNELKVCFKNKLGKKLPIKNHVRVDVLNTKKNTTDILVDGALTTVKAAPVLSFYSLASNENNIWNCEQKNFVHKGDNYFYFYQAQQALQQPSLKKPVLNDKTKPPVAFSKNAIDQHQLKIIKVYKELKKIKPNPSDKVQAKRNLQSFVGKPGRTFNMLGRWKDINTGVIYTIKPNIIEVSNMPKGFYMNYKKSGPTKLRVKVLNNSFDLMYKIKSENEMIQKNTQSGVVRELIRI